MDIHAALEAVTRWCAQETAVDELARDRTGRFNGLPPILRQP
jgi:hypothetical protein